MKNGSVFLPSNGANHWRGLLADPVKHWVAGYSAYALAHCWEAQPGFPPEIAALLGTSSELAACQPLLIFPEWQVPLPGGQRPSQNDAWVLAKCGSGLVSIAVEGKVEEAFDRTIDEWKRDASPGKEERLRFLCDVLGLPASPSGSLRYQLFHRAASAVIEAERFGAAHAVMLVHSFSTQDSWLSDFQAFADLFEIKAHVGTLGRAAARKGLPLHLGWARGSSRFLRAQPQVAE